MCCSGGRFGQVVAPAAQATNELPQLAKDYNAIKGPSKQQKQLAFRVMWASGEYRTHLDCRVLKPRALVTALTRAKKPRNTLQSHTLDRSVVARNVHELGLSHPGRLRRLGSATRGKRVFGVLGHGPEDCEKMSHPPPAQTRRGSARRIGRSSSRSSTAPSGRLPALPRRRVEAC